MADHSFYLSSYAGSQIPADVYPLYQTRALAQLARYRRIYTVTEPDELAADMAVCAMADALYGFDLIANGEGGAVQSASIGSVTVNYGTAAQKVDISPAGREQELYRCAVQYLDIYRGCG